MERNLKAPYANQYLMLTVGFIIMSLGLFMVTNIHALDFFDVWLPLGLLLVGLIMLSSKTYPLTIGATFLLLGAALWLHQTWIVQYPALTIAIDWTFVVVGLFVICGSIGAILLKWSSHRRKLGKSDETKNFL